MRIVHVINSLGGSGGAEHGLVREATGFTGDIDQRVVRLFAKNQLDKELEDAGIEVIALGLDSARAGWNLPIAVARLDSVLRWAKPDVIHSSLFTANLVAQTAGRLRRTPVLSTFTLSGNEHLLVRYQPGASSRRAAIMRRVAAQTARGSRVWFRALTRDALATNCELLGVAPGRATVIPRGVPSDLSPSPLATRQELGLPRNGVLLVNVGRQTAQKGHLSLLTAFAEVRRKLDAHLVIVGRQGEATPQIESALGASGLSQHVTMTGYTPDVHQYVANASVFVFSSFMEGLGTSVLEALAIGRPVVAYDIPPVREISGDGELVSLVPVGDSSALAHSIVETIQSGDDDAEIRRRLVMERFSIDRVSERLQGLLAEVAGR